MRVFLIFASIVFSNIGIANPLLGLPPLSIPKNNPQTVEKIELGRALFNDARFSLTDTISCASCHDETKGFTDSRQVATGINGLTGLRNAPTLLNSAFFEHYFVDGREPSLEAQSLGPLLSPVEHGLKDYQKIIRIIRSDENYLNMFADVFDVSKDQMTMEHVAKAIASFERTLIGGNSLFDQYYFGRDHTKLSKSAARGLLTFRRKGNCGNCHEISFNNALFTDNRFYNIGVGFEYLDAKIDDIVSSLQQGRLVETLALSAIEKAELARFNVTHTISDIGKYKTPTLRNIALTGPYMHDGSMKTLEEVVEYYDKGGDQNQFIDPAIFPLHLTDQEKADLVEFMKSLNSQP
ncbi:MAG: c-type cytochrome [Methylococcales bacterium]|nr:c-type cytochrome [Methylococcales bacterium]